MLRLCGVLGGGKGRSVWNEEGASLPACLDPSPPEPILGAGILRRSNGAAAGRVRFALQGAKEEAILSLESHYDLAMHRLFKYILKFILRVRSSL